ncbi:MerR family transcriptional regulator [Leuconostoc gelidum subsp. aenigmaticum]|uniref:MerR family transcriptional regulator n=1 Tax=Leuconostoc gelidum TaxID=1244 RepID=UPI001CC6BD45|nr:MerR family transcriptional regulator [Leuconostoc gelidum]MBZ6003412.1 MerR family transcriptional regulator [Leuconostoc gelidum subsp. aenigmaticum]
MSSESIPTHLRKFKKPSFDNLQFRIGELARMTNVSTRQLRYWEKQGYVSAIKRNDGQETRLYGFRAYIKVSIIKQHLDDGESLHEAILAANEQLETVSIMQHIMKKAFQGVEKYEDGFVVNLGFFDEDETQLLYASIDRGKVKYKLVNVSDKNAQS